MSTNYKMVLDVNEFSKWSALLNTGNNKDITINKPSKQVATHVIVNLERAPKF